MLLGGMLPPPPGTPPTGAAQSPDLVSPAAPSVGPASPPDVPAGAAPAAAITATPTPPIQTALGADASAVLALIQRHRDAVEDEDRKAQDRLDQIVLVGGAGAILASVTFLKDIAPSPASGTLGILVAAWVALLAGGFCAVLSLLTTRRTARALLQAYAAMLAEGRPTMTAAEHARVEADNGRTRKLSAAGLATFAAGVGLLLTFAGVNLPWRPAGQAPAPAAPTATPPAAQAPTQAPSRLPADVPAAVPSRPEPPAKQGQAVREGVRLHDSAAGPATAPTAPGPRAATAGPPAEEMRPPPAGTGVPR